MEVQERKKALTGKEGQSAKCEDVKKTILKEKAKGNHLSFSEPRREVSKKVGKGAEIRPRTSAEIISEKVAIKVTDLERGHLARKRKKRKYERQKPAGG